MWIHYPWEHFDSSEMLISYLLCVFQAVCLIALHNGHSNCIQFISTHSNWTNKLGQDACCQLIEKYFKYWFFFRFVYKIKHVQSICNSAQIKRIHTKEIRIDICSSAANQYSQYTFEFVCVNTLNVSLLFFCLYFGWKYMHDAAADACCVAEQNNWTQVKARVCLPKINFSLPIAVFSRISSFDAVGHEIVPRTRHV